MLWWVQSSLYSRTNIAPTTLAIPFWRFSFLVFYKVFLFFYHFILLFNFTILYWLCHTSTWIRHKYTRVPHPSIQYRASNLDWWLVSYMLLYMLQCHGGMIWENGIETCTRSFYSDVNTAIPSPVWTLRMGLLTRLYSGIE